MASLLAELGAMAVGEIARQGIGYLQQSFSLKDKKYALGEATGKKLGVDGHQVIHDLMDVTRSVQNNETPDQNQIENIKKAVNAKDSRVSAQQLADVMDDTNKVFENLISPEDAEKITGYIVPEQEEPTDKAPEGDDNDDETPLKYSEISPEESMEHVQSIGTGVVHHIASLISHNNSMCLYDVVYF